MNKLILLIGCVVAGVYANDESYINFVSNFKDRKNPGFQPDIFARCWSEAGIPLAVALGDTFRWHNMCSSTYYDTCENELPAALTVVALLTPEQRDFVMFSLLSWVNGGAPHLCSLGLDYVLKLMRNGGDTCLREIAKTEIDKCNEKMMTLTTGLDYSPPYCNAMNEAMECYIEAIIPCANGNLDNFLRDFFESVVWDSPCSATNPFSNDAVSKQASALMILVVGMFGFATFSLLFNI